MHARVRLRIGGVICTCIDQSFFLPCYLSNEPGHSISYRIVCAPIEYSDQPAHPCSLISLRCPPEYALNPWLPITKTCPYNSDPLKPHLYIVKLGFTGVYIIFLISAQKHRLWVLVRTASPRRF